MEPGRALPAWMRPGEPKLQAYAGLLATVGTERGLIGPREVPRLWDRHLLNCAVVANPELPLVPSGARVADIGSGAGLPGIVWAIVRTDVHVVLIEALLRRATFLEEVVEALGLQDRVEVVRARAEECAANPAWRRADVVTARAVAPLPALLEWMLPLMAPGGVALALKGARAAQEVQSVLESQFGATDADVIALSIESVGEGIVDPPTTVVVARAGTAQ